ncbi:MAG: hypothetical protein IJ246_04215 [Clostridia bacterium]|nr:hypothetical protein [Clostridia bacterium]
MNPQVNAFDWKRFCVCLPGWQERYMEGLIREYTAFLTGSGSASEKFRVMEKRIQKDRQHTGVVPV